MEGDTGLIIDATRKASRFLQRDFFELESLQASDKATEPFCQKSCSKALQTLHEALSKYYKTIIFDNNEVANTKFSGKALLIETLDGLGNLAKSLPFFGIMVTMIVQKGEDIIAEKSVINFPALGEIYYTEKGKGVWLERHSSNLAGALRARVSGTSNLENALIATNISQIDFARTISPNIRVFESYTYALSLLISGKVDMMIVEPRDLSAQGVELFVSEAAGSYHTQNGLIMASNFKLHEKIKSLL
ncbi:MAG: hypothetical protein NWS20_01390 [Rickettsiaceae bacterium]|nr:hypothetical protein [Rickettsiaceae bacterium]MDP4833004.1 hypothetical protein [Rickettsiaceae bacterium]MDP5021364.1 hypothetical protein [Rickettsiaceae bacterium]MDP5083417.1 hypothetical protein [Rickettsiaceae bacterium]